MDDVDLARRLGATTLFSRLPQAQLLDLLRRSPPRHARAGEWLADDAVGLKDHLVLLSGALQAQRCWTAPDGTPACTAWQLNVDADGPGFSLLGAAGSGIRVQALADARYRSIDSEALDELLSWSHLGGHMARLRHLKVFHDLPLEIVRQAFDCMVEREVAAGETVVTQGEEGDAYFIILSGEAEVWVTDPITDETQLAAVLSDADAFGEEALLLGGSRTATVRMISPGRLLVLGKSDFDRLLKPGMVEEVDAATAHELLSRGATRLLDCRYEMEFEESHIPGAQHVPLDRLRREGVFTVDPEPRYVVYCRSGRRSIAAVFLLRERGIHAVSLRGGIRDWPYEVNHAAC